MTVRRSIYNVRTRRRTRRTRGVVPRVSSRVGYVKNKRAWEALKAPLTFEAAAKLLGVKLSDVELMVRRIDLLTIEARGLKMIPVCELMRFRPSR